MTLTSSSQYSVGGDISGLTGTVYLENNNTNTQAFDTNGEYSFTNQLANGEAYNVTVAVQPSDQTCTVTDGTGIIDGNNVINANVTCANNAYTLGGTVTSLNGTVVLLNNGSDSNPISTNDGFTFNTPVAQGAPYNVTVGTQPSGQNCRVTNGSGTINNANVSNVVVSCVSGQAALSTSVSTLALSVNKPATNVALSGRPRQITITNTGGGAATGLNITYPTWPAGTQASSTCGSTLPASASCVITITPGSNTTSSCDAAYTAPVPGVISVSAGNVATPVTSQVVVLSYGCQYQGGFLYSVNDSTAYTGSIGGKVVSLVDQAAPQIGTGPQASSIIWSSNGVGSTSANVSQDLIPLIGDSIGQPTYTNAQSVFNSNYANTSTYPFPQSNVFRTCVGKVDGFCNTDNILRPYDSYQTNYNVGSFPYTIVSGITNRFYYAAGKCTEVINNYPNWYLPAICEMDAVHTTVACTSGTQSMLASLPLLVGNPIAGTPSTSCNPPSDTSCLAGVYWSSTQTEQTKANAESFNNYFISQQILINKANQLGVRCSRALTF